MKNVVFVLLVLSVCGVGGVKFCLPRLIDTRIGNHINNATADIQRQYAQLAEVVKNLEDRQEKLLRNPSESKVVLDFKIDFERWNCWCNLRNKLCHGSEYSEESARFRDKFSDCPDLLKMVDSISSDQNNKANDNFLTNNLLKFANIHRVNENELNRITGYVLLLSIRKAERNE